MDIPTGANIVIAYLILLLFTYHQWRKPSKPCTLVLAIVWAISAVLALCASVISVVLIVQGSVPQLTAVCAGLSLALAYASYRVALRFRAQI